jgi:hypothetical protein
VDRWLRQEFFRWKFKRAQMHLEELRCYDAAFDAKPHDVYTDLNLEKGEAVAHSLATGTEVMRSLMVGDVVHNLRATLDYLVYQLGCLQHDPPKCKTEFPIFKSNADFLYRCQGLNKIRCLDFADQQSIEALQPYGPTAVGGMPGNPQAHPLWILHRLDIGDKHKLLTITTVTATFTKLTPKCSPGLRILTTEEFPVHNPLHAGAVLARYEVEEIGEDPKIEVEAEGTFSAQFGKGTPVKGQEIVPVLEDLCRAVERVVETFRPRFAP